MLELPQITLDDALARGLPVLCASARLRRHLAIRHARAQVHQGHGVWRAPSIESLDAWQGGARERLIDEGRENALLLSAHQELALWEQAITEERGEEGLLQTRAAARSAMHAHALATAWRITPRAIRASGSPEAMTFADWRGAVLGRCEGEDWRLRASLPDVVANGIESGVLEAPPALVLAGFAVLTPMLERLLATLSARGTHLLRLAPGREQGRAQLLAAEDANAELDAIASWCLARLDNNAGANIGIATPALVEHAAALVPNLSRVLTPHSLWPGAPSQTRVIHVAKGAPLAHAPPVDTALLALELNVRALATDACGRLLRSPFLPGADVETAARAMLDARIRQTGTTRLDLASLARAAEENGCVAELATRLGRVQALADAQAPVQAVGEWARYFARSLRHLGWPGEALTDPLARGAEQRFAELLPTLGALGPLVGSCTATVAFSWLRRLAEETPFEAPEGDSARIQIVSIEDAAVMDFDHLWIMGLDDTAWPAAASPNPLLPASLQRSHNMPGSSAAQALADCAELTAALRCAAPEMVVSYTATVGDQERRASALLDGWTDLGAAVPDSLSAEAKQSPNPWSGLTGSVPLERVDDAHGVALGRPGERTAAPGGTALLNNQSECPFRAYVKHRLRAEPLEDPTPGIDPRVTGTLVHGALDFAWKTLKRSPALLALAVEDQESLCANAVTAAIKSMRPAHAAQLEGRLGAIEAARVAELVYAWLDYEKTRTVAFTVIESEEKVTVPVGPLDLNVRADRIDQLDDGRLAVIDYKTGHDIQANGWDQPRMAEPQVPLYALSRSEPVAALALARVRAGEIRFFGQAEQANLLPQVGRGKEPDPDWEERLEHWRTALELLASEAAEGLASVTPTAKACRYCPYPAVCRIHDRPADDELEGAETRT